MQAGEQSCICPECSAVCEGQFNGCSDVWARGPRPVQIVTATSSEVHTGNGQFRSPRNAGGGAYELTSDQVHPHGGVEQEQVPIAAAGHLNVSDVHDPSLTALRTELHTLCSAMSQQQALLTELLAAYAESRKAPDDSLRAEQQEHAAIVQEAGERLRAYLDEAKAALDAAQRERETVFSAVVAVLDAAEAHMQRLVSNLHQSIAGLQESIAADRQSIKELVSEALNQTLRSSEERSTESVRTAIDPAIAEVRRAFEETQAAWARREEEAADAEAGHMRELQACLAAVTDVLRHTESRVAAQLEDSELIDGGMTKIHALITELQASTAVEHREIREEIAAERRAAASLKKQLRSMTDFLPDMILAAARESGEGTVARIERALDKLRRSLQTRPATGRQRQEAANSNRRATAR
jgi:hypothetical protein